jgi:hypothetical protein
MRREPRVIRWMVLKIGDRPQDILHDGSKTVIPSPALRFRDESASVI